MSLAAAVALLRRTFCYLPSGSDIERDVAALLAAAASEHGAGCRYEQEFPSIDPEDCPRCSQRAAGRKYALNFCSICGARLDCEECSERLDSTSTPRGTVPGSGGCGVLPPAQQEAEMSDFNALVEAEVERHARQWEKTEERLHGEISRYRDKLVLAEEELQACETDLKLTQAGLRDALERADILTDTVEDQGAVIGTLQREICQWQVRYAELEASTGAEIERRTAWLNERLHADGLVHLTGPGDHSEQTPADDEWADVDRQTPVEPMAAVTPGGDTPAAKEA